jgi:hypothetical protein
MGFFKRLDLARRNAIDAGADDDELEALMRALRNDPALIDDLSSCFEFPAPSGKATPGSGRVNPGQTVKR